MKKRGPILKVRHPHLFLFRCRLQYGVRMLHQMKCDMHCSTKVGRSSFSRHDQDSPSKVVMGRCPILYIDPSLVRRSRKVSCHFAQCAVGFCCDQYVADRLLVHVCYFFPAWTATNPCAVRHFEAVLSYRLFAVLSRLVIRMWSRNPELLYFSTSHFIREPRIAISNVIFKKKTFNALHWNKDRKWQFCFS